MRLKACHPRVSACLSLLRTCLLAGLVFAAPAAQAAGREITAITVRGTRLVIDSDADFGAARELHLIKGTVTVRYTGALSSTNTRVRMRLVDAAGAVVPLVASTALTGVFNPGLLADGQIIDHTFDYAFDPDAQLDPQKTYFIEASIDLYVYVTALGRWLWQPGLTFTRGPEKRFYHFTKLTTGDPEYNVLGAVESQALGRDWRIQTVAGSDAFPVSYTLRLVRFDEWEQTTAFDTLTFQVIARMYDDQGTQIAIEPLPATEASFTVDMITHILRDPYEVTRSRTLQIKPTVQLDPVYRAYRVEIEVRGRPRPAAAYAAVAQRSTAQSRLLDFNGNIRFSSGATAFTVRMTAAARTATPYTYTVGATYLTAQVDVTAVDYTTGIANYTGSFGVISLRLTDRGLATYNSATALTLQAVGGQWQQAIYRALQFQAGPTITLNYAGATGSLKIDPLPAGLGMTLSGTPPQRHAYLQTALPVRSGVQLNALLAPVNPVTWEYPGGNWVMEESKPVAFKVTAVIWTATDTSTNSRLDFTPTGETFDPVAAWKAQLDAAPSTLPDRMKASNDGYYRLVTGVDTGQMLRVTSDPMAGPMANARLSATFRLGTGIFRPHYPAATVQILSGTGILKVVDDLIDPAASYLPAGYVIIEVDEGSEPDPCASGGYARTTYTLESIGPMPFTPLGGLRAVCRRVGSPVTLPLRWGKTATGIYAFMTDPFAGITFYMPGTFYPFGALGASSFEGGHQYSPAAAALMGYVPGMWRIADTEWPGTPRYRGNTLGGDYAGINLRVGAEAAGFSGRSRVGGIDAGSYLLKHHCRYYARKSGVTGIHDALGGPENVLLYGFNASFDSYGFAFRDNKVIESVTDGSMAVPGPSDFTLPLRKFRFSANGRPLGADLQESIEPVRLAYWNCSVMPLGMTFERDLNDPCSMTAGFIKLYGEVTLPNLGQKLYGNLGFLPDGNLTSPANSLVSSRLKPPNRLTLRGPVRPDGTNEQYNLTPATEIYLNSHAFRADAGPTGFLNVAGSLDVAFFEDLKVHLQTTVGNEGEQDIAPLWFTGGWTAAGNKTFFNDPRGFDPDNRGFPTGTVDAYRAGATYRTTARRNWISGITFSYPLLWDSATRSFRSPDDYTNRIDLLVLEAEHRLDYLSAESAAVSFGLTYSGIPEINLTKMLVNQIDAATGALSALHKALGDAAVGILFLGADSMSDVLGDSLDSMLDGSFSFALEAFMLNVVLPPLGDPGAGGALRPKADWDSSLTIILTDPSAGLRARILTLLGSTTEPGFLTDLRESLDQVIATLDVFVGPADPADPMQGILSTDSNGNYTIASRLVYALIDEIMPADMKAMLGIKPTGSAADQLNAQTTRELNTYAPHIGAIRTALVAMRGKFELARDNLTLGSAAAYMDQLSRSAAGQQELNNLAAVVFKKDVLDHIESRYAGRLQDFAVPANRQASAAILALRLRDRIVGTTIAGGIQVVLRQQLQDLQASFDQLSASAFATINRVIKGVVNEALGSIDEAISPMNGALSSVAGAGSLKGHAQIRKDKLESLRLDADFELKLDEPLKFAGFLEIKQLESNSPYGPGRDIAFGAYEVPITLLDSTAYYTIKAGVTLNESGSPLAIGGSIEMVRGEIRFESFRVTAFGAALKFGAVENYFAAKLAMEFQSFSVAGGLFVGRSHSIEPLMMVDADVAALITPPFTGAYVYGQLFMPIVDLGCFFNVSAGLGVGVFYFVEGPMYGGKIYAAVKGEALCVVSVKGEIVLVGMKSDIFRFTGKGKVSGKVGYCPFCVKFGKTIKFSYDERAGFDADL